MHLRNGRITVALIRNEAMCDVSLQNDGSSRAISCENELEALTWYAVALTIGKVTHLRYREYTEKEKTIINAFEEKKGATFRLANIGHGHYDWDHEFPVPTHLKTIPASLRHVIENLTLGHPNSPVNTTDPAAVALYKEKLRLCYGDDWDRALQAANAEFGCKSVEENPGHKANNAELVVTQYLGATDALRDWYRALKGWHSKVAQDGRKTPFGWAPYIELPTEITETLLAQGKPAKCHLKRDSQKALKAKIERLEKSNADLKSKRAQDKKKKRNGESGDEAADRELKKNLLDAQTELGEWADEVQGLKDLVGNREHTISVQNTKIIELEGKLQEKTMQFRMAEVEIKNYGIRVGELKGEIEWFKNVQHPPYTPSGALVYGSASMSLINTQTPPT